MTPAEARALVDALVLSGVSRANARLEVGRIHADLIASEVESFLSETSGGSVGGVTNMAGSTA